MTTTSGPSAAIISDNLIMARPATAPLRRILGAPFSRRTWSELAYTVVSALLAVCALIFIVPTLASGLLWGLSAPGVRKFGARSRQLARGLLGEVVADPPPPRLALYFKVRTPEAGRLAVVALGAGGRVRVRDNQLGLTIRKLSPSRIAELAAGEGLGIGEIQPASAAVRWLSPRMSDPVAWRARAYYAIKVPLAGLSLAVAGVFWLGGLFFLTFPAWWALGVPSPSLFLSLLLIPVGAAKLLAAPWLIRGTTDADRRLVRTLLGPVSPAERIHVLAESRARVVDDSAARLRSIERDLHGGTGHEQVRIDWLQRRLADAPGNRHVDDAGNLVWTFGPRPYRLAAGAVHGDRPGRPLVAGPRPAQRRPRAGEPDRSTGLTPPDPCIESRGTRKCCEPARTTSSRCATAGKCGSTASGSRT
jgi:hypothetical protein